MWCIVMAENVLYGLTVCGYHWIMTSLSLSFVFTAVYFNVYLLRHMVTRAISLTLSPPKPAHSSPGGCSHARATAYWVESLRARSAEEMFRAWPCSDWDTFFTGGCPDCGSGCLDMGFPTAQGWAAFEEPLDRFRIYFVICSYLFITDSALC